MNKSYLIQSNSQKLEYILQYRGVAQLGVAHLNGVQEVAGSNPVAPTITTNDLGQAASGVSLKM